MKTMVMDPWGNSECSGTEKDLSNNFEDSFVIDEVTESDFTKLSDSQQYLNRLYARLKNIQGGSSKRDLVNSLSQIKEDSIARFITASGGRLESEQEVLLVANPLIRHITPHLQAMAASELVELLKADVLQIVTNEHHAVAQEKLDNSPLSSTENNL